MDQLILISPEIILTVTALVVLTVDLVSDRAGRTWAPWLTLLGVALAIADAAYYFGKREPAFGTTYMVDEFLTFFRITALVIAALIVFASKDYVERRTRYIAEFYALLLFVTLSVILLAGSIDLIMIFLSFEFLSITSYIMVGYLRDDVKSSEGSIKYFLYGSVSSAIMLYGMSLLYGASGGQTNLTSIAQAFASAPAGSTDLIVIAIILTIVGFGFKIALAPFHQWSPEAYEGAPTPVTAFISVGPKVAGFAVLARVMITALPSFATDWTNLLWAIAAVSMTLGNLVALRQTNIKRLLAYSSIAQTGYMLIGIVANLATGEGLRGILVYLVAYLFTNIGLFIAVIAYSGAIGSDEIADYAGMIRRAPGLALAMVIFFLSLAGIPPTAGFIGKFLVFGAALDAARAGGPSQLLIWLAIIGAVNSVVSVGYYFNVVRYMFFMPPKETTPVSAGPTLNWSLAFATVMTLVIGLVPQPFITFAELSVKAIFKS